jgi:hypothetical protein
VFDIKDCEKLGVGSSCDEAFIPRFDGVGSAEVA